MRTPCLACARRVFATPAGVLHSRALDRFSCRMTSGFGRLRSPTGPETPRSPPRYCVLFGARDPFTIAQPKASLSISVQPAELSRSAPCSRSVEQTAAEISYDLPSGISTRHEISPREALTLPQRGYGSAVSHSLSKARPRVARTYSRPPSTAMCFSLSEQQLAATRIAIPDLLPLRRHVTCQCDSIIFRLLIGYSVLHSIL
ncbi:hypothetical protein QBC46DRAFT_25948 [Diplogelasinospora grovesii]|uniref:Uncharacterized protein n=1 Tax=Diplogelasinospora grovesii TaxID=303347 RepID=A0AAN6MZU7_9PEZI|nr:hypothetical protein QBC46DRAFT_25948 [Diplogelasinospora grovesii]